MKVIRFHRSEGIKCTQNVVANMDSFLSALVVRNLAYLVPARILFRVLCVYCLDFLDLSLASSGLFYVESSFITASS